MHVWLDWSNPRCPFNITTYVWYFRAHHPLPVALPRDLSSTVYLGGSSCRYASDWKPPHRFHESDESGTGFRLTLSSHVLLINGRRRRVWVSSYSLLTSTLRWYLKRWRIDKHLYYSTQSYISLSKETPENDALETNKQTKTETIDIIVQTPGYMPRHEINQNQNQTQTQWYRRSMYDSTPGHVCTAEG